jgi:AcrR family transcriptional regulator
MSADRARRDEILDTASKLFASSGLRTSLQEIADACGILPGSLYHHFDSKEAIVVELIRRYQAELDQLAEIALKELKDSDPQALPERIAGLGKAIAQCAASHSAAVQFSFYEPPAGASNELVQLTDREPKAIQEAMLETLRASRSSGFIRPGIDLPMLADRMCQTMLHMGLGMFHRYTVHRVAGLMCDILLHGVAAVPPANDELDRSNALSAVERVMQQWNQGDGGAEGDRAALIRGVALEEFGRKGYEVTTIRDIAAAASLSTGSVYRVIGSKEELLGLIMRSFNEKVIAGWNAALRSESTAAEKLDAVSWLQINVLERFSREWKIQLSWLRQSPPDIQNPGWSFPAVIRRLKTLLSEGTQSGEIRIARPSAALTALCVLDVTWIPENIVRSAGKRASLTHARDTVLRGVAER